MSYFDSKTFNPQVFGRYISTIPKTRLNEMLNSGILSVRSDLRSKFSDQTGGNYQLVPITGLIGGTAQNYDGETDITPSQLDTYEQGMVVIGRAKSWNEKDFTTEITGKDFMSEVASQVSEYWDDVDQDMLLSIMVGIFSMTGSANLEFVNGHTYDISDGVGDAAVFGAATLNTAIQQASGDHKKSFALSIMHSAVATGLENLQLLNYMKYTDAQGIERALPMATVNGKIVLIDDSMPTETTEDVAETVGVYNSTITTNLATDDVINIAGKELTCVASGAVVGTSFVAAGTITGTVTAIVAALASNMPDGYVVTASTTKLVLTQGVGEATSVPPVVTVTGTGVVGSLAIITQGVAATTGTTKYTTYVFGKGSIEYDDMGVKTPYEMNRDPNKNGGVDELITRERKLFAPRGISFTKASMATASPTNDELENGANWELVKNNTGATTIDDKVIYIARIISKV